MKKQHLAIVLLLNLGLYFSAQSQNPLPEFADLKKIDQLSSKNEESMPFPYLNGKKMYFVRTVIAGSMRQRVTGQDIWSSEFNETSWSAPSNLFEEANDNGNNAVIGVSNDGNTLYLFNSIQTRRKLAKGIAVTKRDAEGKWSDLEKVDVPGFKIGQGLYSLYMTPNEKILLIGMSPSDTSAQSDLFVSLKDAEGNWGELKDLGSIINTDGTEITPFIDQSGTTLYFSSDGHKGLGGMDVFTADRLDDSWSNWSEPLNLGAPINSDAFDAYFMFSNEKEALFTSNRDGPFSDIYSTKIKEEPIIVKAEEKVFAQVFFEAMPLEDLDLLILDVEGNLVGKEKTDKDGRFSYVKSDNQAHNIQLEEENAELQNNAKIYIIDKNGKKLERLTLNSTGSYASIAKNVDSEIIDGLFEYNNLPQQNIMLIVYDENNFPVDTLVTDENGKFSYKKLKGDENFTIRPIMSVDDDLMDKIEIFATNKSGKKLSNLILNTNQVKEDEVIAEVIAEKNTQITNTTNSKGNQQVEVKPSKDNQIENETVTVNKLPQPSVANTAKELNGKTIYFDFNERVLTADDKITLDKIINSLKSNTESRVTMIGFTDNIGSKETNVKVASARARASRAYLTDNNISKNRIDIYGYGEVMFKGDNSTDEGRALNRRVEIQIN
jgi:outer membrane protein OmpA-like peptidoglycan-associated protein/uncharacterized protein YbjQ (UPF0145 family)